VYKKGRDAFGVLLPSSHINSQMAELVGLITGVVGVVGPLLSTIQAGYDLLSAAQAIGSDVDRLGYRLGLEKHKLDTWAQQHKLEDPEYLEAMQLKGETMKHIIGVLRDHETRRRRQGLI
jgi:hypothetical protein